ncbi:MAG: hypothetical protein P9G45_18720 [Candidatus Contendobacter sp.]|nr:hypothetical protein [Candidatus Contendobacter sp.]
MNGSSPPLPSRRLEPESGGFFRILVQIGDAKIQVVEFPRQGAQIVVGNQAASMQESFELEPRALLNLIPPGHGGTVEGVNPVPGDHRALSQIVQQGRFQTLTLLEQRLEQPLDFPLSGDASAQANQSRLAREIGRP